MPPIAPVAAGFPAAPPVERTRERQHGRGVGRVAAVAATAPSVASAPWPAAFRRRPARRRLTAETQPTGGPP
jgi:hypothetical protein